MKSSIRGADRPKAEADEAETLTEEKEQMKIEEIKALVPLADLYELNPNARYIMVVSRKSIDSDVAETICKRLPGASILLYADEPPQFFEFIK